LREDYKDSYEKMAQIDLERERWRLYAEADKSTMWHHGDALGKLKIKHLRKLSPEERKKAISDLALGRLPETRVLAKQLVERLRSEMAARPDGLEPGGEQLRPLLERRELTDEQVSSVLSAFDREMERFAVEKRDGYVARLSKLYNEREDLIEGRIKRKLMKLKRVRQFYGVRPKDVKWDEKKGKWVATPGPMHLELTYRPGVNNVSKAISSVEFGYVTVDGFLAAHGGFGFADIGGRSIDDGFDMLWTAGFYFPFGWLSPSFRSLLRRRWMIRPMIGKILAKRGDPRDPMEWMQKHILDERGGAPFSKAWVQALSMTYGKQVLWLGPVFLLNQTFQAGLLHYGQLDKLVDTKTPTAALASANFPTPPSIPPPVAPVVPPTSPTQTPEVVPPGPTPIPPAVGSGSPPYEPVFGSSPTGPGPSEDGFPPAPVPIPPPV
jgi:hypothetical protein